MEAGLAPGRCRETWGAQLLVWSALCVRGGWAVDPHSAVNWEKTQLLTAQLSLPPAVWEHTPSCRVREPAPHTRPSVGPSGLWAPGEAGPLPPHTCGLSPAPATAGSLGDHRASRHRGYRCPPPSLDAGSGLQPMPRRGETGPSLRAGPELQTPFQISSLSDVLPGAQTSPTLEQGP